MKALLGTNKSIVLILGIIAFALILTHIQAQKARPSGKAGTGKVEIREEGITMHPSVALSAEDAAALDKVLQKYDKTLYLFRYDTLGDGKILKAKSLGTRAILESLEPEIKRAKENGEDGVENNSACPNAGCNAQQYTKDYKGAKEAAELQKDLVKILEKYSK